MIFTLISMPLSWLLQMFRKPTIAPAAIAIHLLVSFPQSLSQTSFPRSLQLQSACHTERESQRSKQPDILRQRAQKEVSLSFWFFKSVYCSWFLFVNSDFMFNFFSSSLFPYARDFGVINLGTVCHYPVDTSDPDNDKVFCQFQMISYIDSCNKVLLSRCL